MYKIVIWGAGQTYNQYINLVKMQELRGKIYGGGYYTAKEKLYDYLDGYRYVAPENLAVADIDYVVVASEKYFEEIVREAMRLGFERERILPVKVFAIPNFDFGDYVKLLHSHISILANTCWGGMAYNMLGMRFRSPLINMHFNSDEDYLKILFAPKDYFGMELRFDSWGNSYPRAYPICKLGDILLHFNHSSTMEEVEDKWYDRIKRINYDNLFVMMCTESKNILDKFSDLHYMKKVCFVPFESSYSSACTLKFACKKPDLPFWYCTNQILRGTFNDYDIIPLLNSGEVNHNRVIWN